MSSVTLYLNAVDNKRSLQRSISIYALHALVNISINYKIFLSRATMAIWERNYGVSMF